MALGDGKARKEAQDVVKGLKDASKETEKFEERVDQLVDAFTSISAAIQTTITDAIDSAQGLDKVSQKIAKTYEREIVNGIKKIIVGLDSQLSIQQKINQGLDAEADIQKLIEKNQTARQVVQSRINNLQLLFNDQAAMGVAITDDQRDQMKQLKGELENVTNLNQKQIAQLKEEAAQRKKILGDSGKTLGFIDNIAKKIGGSDLSEFLNFDKALDSTAKIGIEAGKNDGIIKGTNKKFSKSAVLTQQVGKNLNPKAGAAALFGIASKLFQVFKDMDQKVTDIAREFSISKAEAMEFKNTLGAGNITIKEGFEAVKALNAGLGGTGMMFNKTIIKGAAETLALFKLSEEAVGGIAIQALATGKNIEEVRLNQIDVATDVEREFGIRLDMTKVLEEANKITGLTRANVMAMPGGLAKAVATAKSLGIEMSAVSNAAGKLLDFESSIAAEMEAELLIGRNLNLDKARAAALAGDETALMQELVREAGSLEQLQSMNVLQQQALADALGLSADELANTLVTQEALTSQKDEQLDRDATLIELAEKQESAAEMQKRATENLMDAMSSLKNIVLGVAAAAAAAAIALTLGAAAPAIIAAALTAGVVFTALGSQFDKVGDAMIPSGGGPFAITDMGGTAGAFGSTVMTTRGDGIGISPNINRGAGGGDAEIKKTNRLLERILAKEGNVQIDGTNAGTAFAMTGYRIQ